MGEERPVSLGWGGGGYFYQKVTGGAVSWKEAGGAVSHPVGALMAAQGLGSLVGSWGKLWTPELDCCLAESSPLTQRQGQRSVAVRVAWTLAGRPVTRGAGQREGGRPGGPGLLPEETRSIASWAAERSPAQASQLGPGLPRPAGLRVRPGRGGLWGRRAADSEEEMGRSGVDAVGAGWSLCPGPSCLPSPGVPSLSPHPPGQFNP